MKITQISVFLENRKGRLYDVCELLGKNDINIMALTIAETENFGVLRIIVDNPESAIEVLRKDKFVANITDVVIIEVEDRPGGLASILKTINEENLNIEYMHAFFKKGQTNPFMVFRFDDPDNAIKILSKKGINILQKNFIYK